MAGRNRPNVHTLRAQWLGQRLRELREANGLTLKEAGEYLQRNLSAISRYELAEWPIRRGDVLALLDLYRVTDEDQRRRLIELAEEVWRTDEWDAEYGDLIDRSFIDVPWLESRAERICSYHLALVPGLLQAPEYAEAVIRAVEGPETADAQVARFLALRLHRQRVLEEPKPTRVEAIVDEAALRRPVGGPKVLRAQLEHLADLSRRRHVTLRVVPASVGAHPGVYSEFIVFELPRPYPEVAYVESLAGRLYLEPPKSERFVRAYARLRNVALNDTESVERITEIAEDFHG